MFHYYNLDVELEIANDFWKNELKFTYFFLGFSMYVLLNSSVYSDGSFFFEKIKYILIIKMNIEFESMNNLKNSEYI